MTQQQADAFWAVFFLVLVVSLAAVIGICVKCNRDVKVTALERGLVWKGATYESRGTVSVDGNWEKASPQPAR